MAKKIESICILGGGTSGWMTAAALAKTLLPLGIKITVVESPNIKPIGVGEATIPPIVNFLNFLEISELEFIKDCSASYKLAIRFDDWAELGASYFHPFGSIGVNIDSQPFYLYWQRLLLSAKPENLDDFSPSVAMCKKHRFFHPSKAEKDSFLAGASYAFHFDAGKAADYFKRYALSKGVQQLLADVEQVTHCEFGVESLVTKKGQRICADFFVDCGGFKAPLIGEALGCEYESWASYLPCDRAIACQVEGGSDIPPYTIAKAQRCGWSWEIPLQTRRGIGYVYSSQYASDDEALSVIADCARGREQLIEPRVIPFETGVRKRMWEKNCVAFGLSSGFVEPLESTAIHLVTKGIRAFLDLFPAAQNSEPLADEYNRIMVNEYRSIRDFVLLHYCTTKRDDTAFWRDCQVLPKPESLNHKLALYKKQGKVFFDNNELFKEPSWHCVMAGMKVKPDAYPVVADSVSEAKLRDIFQQVKGLMENMAAGLPSHAEFLEKYCSEGP